MLQEDHSDLGILCSLMVLEVRLNLLDLLLPVYQRVLVGQLVLLDLSHLAALLNPGYLKDPENQNHP